MDLGALSGGYNWDGAWMEPFATQSVAGHLLLGGFSLDGGVLSPPAPATRRRRCPR
ncbi:MAG: hypothetical protein ACXU86_06895 [Archangium sp.]